MRYSERNHEKRIEYLRTLRQVVKDKGSEHIVYLDESGFERTTHRAQGYAVLLKCLNRAGHIDYAPGHAIEGMGKNNVIAPLLHCRHHPQLLWAEFRLFSLGRVPLIRIDFH